MIRAGNKVTSWARMCSLLMLKPRINSPNCLNFQSLKQSETLNTLDKSIMFNVKYGMAKKKEDKDEKKKKEKTKIK